MHASTQQLHCRQEPRASRIESDLFGKPATLSIGKVGKMTGVGDGKRQRRRSAEHEAGQALRPECSLADLVCLHVDN
jgi:hypothetical protein